VLVRAVPQYYDYVKPDIDTHKVDYNEGVSSDDGDELSASARAAAASPPGTNFGKYFLSRVPVDWWSAKSYCQASSMRLLVILSSDENSEIVGLLDSLGVSQVWISGFDGVSDGSYTWASVGIPFDYTNWMSGSPPRDPANNCVFLGTNSYWGGKSGWDDMDCRNTLPFVCERVK